MRRHSRGPLLLLTLCAVPVLLAAAPPGQGNNGNGNGNGNAKPTPTPTPVATPAPVPTLPPVIPATIPPLPGQSPAPAMPVQAAPQAGVPVMQAPAQGTPAMGQAQAPAAAAAAPSDPPMNDTSSAMQGSSPSRPPSGESGVATAGLSKGPSLNLFPGVLVLFPLLIVVAGLLGLVLPTPMRPSLISGPGRPRLRPAAAAAAGVAGEMTVTHRTPTPGLSLPAVEPAEEPAEPPVPPPPPSKALLPPLPAPGAEVFVADATSAEDGSTELTAEPRRLDPPSRL